MKVKYATIIVRSMDESIAFYSDVMGFEVDSQYRPWPGVVITLMRGAGEAMVELVENGASEVSARPWRRVDLLVEFRDRNSASSSAPRV